MNYSVYIPARLDSTRLPRKLLLPLASRPVLHHTIDRALESAAQRVVVVTDNDEIAESVKEYQLTELQSNQKQLSIFRSQKAHKSGTSRISEAVSISDMDIEDLIINLQADEPMMPASIIDQVAQTLACSTAPAATIATRITEQVMIDDPNIVKVVMDTDNQALYFSRSPIPYCRDSTVEQTYYKHFGLYAYRSDWLKTWDSLPPSSLEQVEKLEQLRILAAGHAIQIGIAEIPKIIGIDTAEQLAQAEQLMKVAQKDF